MKHPEWRYALDIFSFNIISHNLHNLHSCKSRIKETKKFILMYIKFRLDHI
jgi:hypothetical protein